MKSVYKKSNRLFHALIGVSVVIHVFIFMHVAGFYESRTLSFIEMTLEDISKPFFRDIPRPRIKPRDVPKTQEVKKLKISRQVMPQFKPVKVAPVTGTASGIGETISATGLLDGAGLDMAGWDPDAMAGMKELLTRKDYFDLVQLRIESNKEYPPIAKAQRIEGRTAVEFVISLSGAVSGLKVIQSSRNATLDEAALDAVKKSSPFPRPPIKLFNGPIAIEIAVVFETT